MAQICQSSAPASAGISCLSQQYKISATRDAEISLHTTTDALIIIITQSEDF
jgi:hypothetical protein